MCHKWVFICKFLLQTSMFIVKQPMLRAVVRLVNNIFTVMLMIKSSKVNERLTDMTPY